MFRFKKLTVVFGAMLLASTLTAFIITGGNFQILLSNMSSYFSSSPLTGGNYTITASAMPSVGAAFSSGGGYTINDGSLANPVQSYVRDNLADVIIFPNPFKPGSGGIFDANAATFRYLTLHTKIRIFTIVGELVKTIETENPTGEVAWDARNDSGENLASGVYLYIITNSDNPSQRTKGKLAIIK